MAGLTGYRHPGTVARETRQVRERAAADQSQAEQLAPRSQPQTSYAQQPGSLSGISRAVGGGGQSERTFQPGGGGTGQIGAQAYEEQDTARLRAQLERDNQLAMLEARQRANDAAFDRRLGALGLGSEGGGGAGSGGGAGDGGSPGGGYDPVKAQQARDEAYARAKDVAGRQARAALDSVRGVLGEAGRLGGGYEDTALASVINRSSDQMTDFNTRQLTTDLERAGEVEDRDYAGGLTRRGQDISQRNSLLGLLNSTLY